MKKITIANFSGHRNGNSEKIANYLFENLKDHYMVEVIHFADLEINACGKCEYQCFEQNNQCPYFYDDIVLTYKKMAQSSFCVFIIPNYSDVPCSNYFIFRERSQCTVENNLAKTYAEVRKHFIVISSTSQDIFKTLLRNEVCDENMKMTFLNSHEVGAKQLSGDFLEHPLTLELLDKIIANLNV